MILKSRKIAPLSSGSKCVTVYNTYLIFFVTHIGNFDQVLCVRLFEETSLFNFVHFLRRTHKAEYFS